MILVDTSVWVDHLRAKDKALASLLHAGQALAHPFVVGELALGTLRQRAPILAALQGLPQATVATDWETLQFIERNYLLGAGIGYVDAHLLAAVRLTPGAILWTRDKRMRAAGRLGLAADPPT